MPESIADESLRKILESQECRHEETEQRGANRVCLKCGEAVITAEWAQEFVAMLKAKPALIDALKTLPQDARSELTRDSALMNDLPKRYTMEEVLERPSLLTNAARQQAKKRSAKKAREKRLVKSRRRKKKARR